MSLLPDVINALGQSRVGISQYLKEIGRGLDATHARLQRASSASGRPVVVLPSYNGARRLPVLTPLLAGLVARRGLPVLIHGTATESSRVFVRDVLHAIEVQEAAA